MEKLSKSSAMRSLRILYLIHGLDIGDQSGGAELHAIRTAQLLNHSEFTPAIFCMWEFESETERKWLRILERENILVFGFTSRNGSLMQNFRQVLSKLWSTTTTFSPDIIHSHSERGDWMNALIRIFHPTHPLAVRTVHIDQQWQTQPFLGYIINNAIFPFVFNYETAVSQTIYKILNTKLRQKKKIGVCYNGIDESAFDNRSLEKPVFVINDLELSQKRPLIGIIGRLTEQKGHTNLLEAMYLVHRTHQAHLLIIGGGPLESSLKEQVARLDIQEFIHFLGTQTRKDVDNILSHLDLFVLPSLWEGFPTVLLEAMAKKVPIIATDVSGSCELIQSGETGLLVSPNEPQRLAKAMINMLEHPSMANAMTKQAKYLARQYTIQNTVSCYTEIYKQIVLK